MFIAYFDESGHPADSSLLTLAALVAPEKAWTAFENKWQKILRRYRVSVFHMTDYENRKGEFAGWDNEKRVAFISNLAAIVKNTMIYGVAHSIPVPHWKESIEPFFEDKPNSIRSRQAPYVHLLASCLKDIEEFVKLPNGETIACVFDQNDLIKHFAVVFYNALVVAREWKNVFGSLRFADKARIIPLQAADMLAYEAWKYTQHWDGFPEGRSPRKLLKNLCATNCIMFRRFNRSDLKDFRKTADGLYNYLSTQGLHDEPADLLREYEAAAQWLEQQNDILLDEADMLHRGDERID